MSGKRWGIGPNRRQFLLGTTAGVASLGAPRAAGAAVGPSVAVLGGGVAGLTTAHELAERGFAVTVYERRALGGKARSIPVPGTGRGGRRDLPGEHGFRFFPGFYQNLPDTLRRIPFPGNANGVHDNLVNGTEWLFSRDSGRADLRFPLLNIDARPILDLLPLDRLLEELRALVETQLHLPPHEALLFVRRLLVYLTSCDERRFGEWEFTTWPDFIRADGKSQDYQRLLADGPTRVLTATRTADASAHTVGLVLEGFLYNFLGRGADGAADRLLNLPTNEAWIDPWEQHLRKLGVQFRLGWSVEGLELERGRIAAADVRDPGGRRQRISADFYVCALPVEHARRIWTEEMLAVDPQLRAAGALRTEWMSGLMFYLDRPTPVAHGHIYYVDSPWAMTAISQAQFWPDRSFPTDYGDGTVADCMSVILSDWDTPGVLFGKPAKQLTPEQVKQEVWEQIKRHLNDTGSVVLDDASLRTWFLDPGVQGIGGPNPTNADELSVQPVGSWRNRPGAQTTIPNFALAGDYLQVEINAASMEGANAGGRMAANAVLDASGSSASPVELHPLYRAPELAPIHAQDQLNYAAGLPNLLDIDP